MRWDVRPSSFSIFILRNVALRCGLTRWVSVLYYLTLFIFCCSDSIGGKITKTAGEIKLIESNGQIFSFEIAGTPRLTTSGQLMWEHFRKCLKHCQRLETSIESLSQESGEVCFPLIVGRRPPQYSRVQPTTGNRTNKENIPLQSSHNLTTAVSQQIHFTSFC